MSPAVFFVLGITHRLAPLGVRERLALAGDADAFAAELAAVPGLAEFVVLNTCNRFEIYGVARHRGAIDGVASAFREHRGLMADEFAALRVEARDAAAVLHLFRVAAGLDSQMLGETEIFGQVKKAYALAQARPTVGPVLNRIFQKAFQAVKQARSETAITEGLVSVANVAADLALKIFGPTRPANILLLGAGDIGRKCGRAFLSRGAHALTIGSRRFEKAAEVAAEIGGRALALEDCLRSLADFDVVLCATSSPAAVITADAVAAAMRQRRGRPIFFIDTALPRDVDAAVARLENVFLYDLDDLANIAAENRSAREAEIAKCQALLAGRAALLWVQVERLLAPPEAEATSLPSAAALPA